MHKAPCESVKWHVSQIKKSSFDDITEDCNFTCIEFNDTGDLLALGDKSGRITIYHLKNKAEVYEIYCAFTSHEPEFDYLKSLEIEEKINSISWLPKCTSAHHLLSANDKTIKLWSISERNVEAYNFNLQTDENSNIWNPELSLVQECTDLIGPPVPCITSSAQLRIPKLRSTSRLIVEARPRRVFANAHAYHINAICPNSDQETFLSSDDLRINLWHLNISNQSFTIVDLKPSNMEDLTEVITCARFHQTQCHLLAYSTSRGLIRLCDMRQHALCDDHVMVFEDPNAPQDLGFFTDIVASLSDFRFGSTGNYLLARDYLTLKVWDMRMGDRPCELYHVHEPFRSELCMLYENDVIFDKFFCGWSHDDRFVVTGSYGNAFRVFDRHNAGSDWLYDLTDFNTDLPFVNNSHTSVVLNPKQFLTPDDPLSLQLGLSSISVVPLGLTESILLQTIEPSASNNDEVHTTDATSTLNSFESVQNLSNSSDMSEPTSSPIGSKRRKQLLSTSTTDLDEMGNHIWSDLDLQSANSKTDCATHSNSNDCGRPASAFDSKRAKLHDLALDDIQLTGFHDLDCQRKLLYLSWHPNRLLIATVSGNQIFLISDQPSRVNSKLTGFEIVQIKNGSVDDDNNNNNSSLVQLKNENHSRQHEVTRLEQNESTDNNNNNMDGIKRRRRRRNYALDESHLIESSSDSSNLFNDVDDDDHDDMLKLDLDMPNTDCVFSHFVENDLSSDLTKMDCTSDENDSSTRANDVNAMKKNEMPLEVNDSQGVVDSKCLCIDSLLALTSDNCLPPSDNSVC